MSNPPFRIFIIDDDPLMRFGLSQLFQGAEDFSVVGSNAFTTGLAVEIVKSRAQILIVDIPTPRESGIRFLKSLAKLKLPVVVFTKSDDEIAQDLIPLLEAGAVGFVLKPQAHQTIRDIKEQIFAELRLNTPKSAKRERAEAVHFCDPLKAIAIGSSTGGPEALAQIIPQIPEKCPYGIVIVQHMPAGFTSRFAKRLDGMAPITVREAEEGDAITAGQALLAPGNYHLEFKEIIQGNRRLARISLNQDPPVWNLRPTVDRMMVTLAPIYEEKLVGIILTGMGEDGVIGMREIKLHRGHTLVQDEKTSVVFGMAQQVVKNKLADEVLPLKALIPRALELLG